MAGWKLGKSGKLYVGAAGATATTEVTNIMGDVTLDLSSESATDRTRANKWSFTDIIGLDASIKFNMAIKKNDASRSMITTAYADAGPIALLFKTSDDGEIEFDADFVITDISAGQPKGGYQTLDVTCKATNNSDRDPELNDDVGT